MQSLDAFAGGKLAALEAKSLRRWLTPTRRHDGAVVERDRRRLISFSCNDYLGLSQHPQVRAAAAEAALADLSALRRGRLAVFASQTIASYWLPRRLVDFHTAHPGVELDVQIGNTREVAQAVLNGAAEIGLVEGAVDEPALSQVQVGSDRLAVLVTPDHPWATRRRLEAKDLAGQPWVLREVGSGTRSTLEAAVRDMGVDPATLSVSMTLPSNEAVLAAAEAGPLLLTEGGTSPEVVDGLEPLSPARLAARLVAAPRRGIPIEAEEALR